MSNAQIAAYNETLVATGRETNFIDYIHNIIRLFYPNSNSDFIDTLLYFASKDEFCVPHTFLEKYGVLAGKNIVKKAKKLFRKMKFQKDVDYVTVMKSYDGTNKIYVMHPDAFELCILRASTNIEYIRQQVLLYKLIKQYDNYLSLLKEEKMENKNGQLDGINQQLHKVMAQMDEIGSNIKHNSVSLSNHDAEITQLHGALDKLSDGPIIQFKTGNMVIPLFKSRQNIKTEVKENSFVSHSIRFIGKVDDVSPILPIEPSRYSLSDSDLPSIAISPEPEIPELPIKIDNFPAPELNKTDESSEKYINGAMDMLDEIIESFDKY